MSNNRRRRRPHDVRGLAPLELVLSLPILVFLAALMVNFGTVANWKLRASTVARQQLWGSRLVPYAALGGNYAKPDYTQPQPAFWQAAAGTMGNDGGGDDSNLDQNQIGAATTQGSVARGPSVGRFSMNSAQQNLLDPATGFLDGWSKVTRSFPFFNRWAPFQVGVSSSSKPQNQLLNDPWPYWDPRMHWNDTSQYHEGLDRNLDVRVPVLYTEPLGPTALYQTPRDALYNFYNDPANQTSIGLLDGVYPGSFSTQYPAGMPPLFPDFNELTYPWGNQGSWGSPNAYPFQIAANSNRCDNTYSDVKALVDSYVQNLPLALTQGIQYDMNYYNNLITQDQAALKAGQNADPPMSADQQAQLQQQISDDQAIVSALQNLSNALSPMLSSTGS